MADRTEERKLPDDQADGSGETGDEVTLVRARDILGELANRVEFKEERIVVTRRGKASFALVPIGDLDRLIGAA